MHPNVRGGKGGKLLDNFLEIVSKAAESEGISEEAVQERLWAVRGAKWEPYLLLQDAKSYGGKGGKLLDNFLEKVSKAAESEGISEEAVRERLWAVTGAKREPYLVLLDAKFYGGSGGGGGRCLRQAPARAAGRRQDD